MGPNYTRYLEVDTLVNEYLTDREINGAHREEIHRRWVSRATEQLVRTRCWQYRLALLTVKNNVAELPKYIENICLVGSLEAGHPYVGREEMRSWVYDVMGNDCQVEVRLNCPKCHNSQCSCPEPLIELEMDKLYREERPYLTHVNYWNFLGYSAPMTDGFSCMAIAPKFKLMRPVVSNAVFWASSYFLGVCNDLGTAWASPHYFSIDQDKLITDMREGQILMAYFSQVRDSQGYMKVPDNPYVVEAILAYMDMQYAKRKARAGNQTDRNNARDALMDWKQAQAIAINKLEMPSEEEWEGIINRYYKIPIDRFYYG